MALIQPEIYAAIDSLLRGRDRGALCVVVAVRGSAPGKLGAKMLLYADGRQLGTVGGAGLEERVKAQAREAIRTGRGGTETYKLAKWTPDGLNSICGGEVEVYVEPLIPNPHLLLCGGGHVAHAIAQQCDLLGYRYAIFDARPDYIGSDRFPTATGRFTGDLDALFAGGLSLDAYSHIYLLGHSWEIDLDLLTRILPATSAYVGMIGSTTKGETMRRELAERRVPAEDIARLICPIGLLIGAESPAEIAIAVMADLIQRTKTPTAAPA